MAKRTPEITLRKPKTRERADKVERCISRAQAWRDMVEYANPASAMQLVVLNHGFAVNYGKFYQTKSFMVLTFNQPF